MSHVMGTVPRPWPERTRWTKERGAAGYSAVAATDLFGPVWGTVPGIRVEQ
jgi:hypothetical protein